jgi:hypothetical protein
MNTVSADRAVLFLGDTNLHGNNPVDAPEVIRFLEANGLTELCDYVECPEPGRIDRVFYRSSNALSLTGIDWWIPDTYADEAGRPLSDHDPIASQFEWKANSP